MAHQDGLPASDAVAFGPSERESHSEHEAALDATVFRAAGDPIELILELDAGRLRVRGRQDR